VLECSVYQQTGIGCIRLLLGYPRTMVEWALDQKFQVVDLVWDGSGPNQSVSAVFCKPQLFCFFVKTV
jgi:hypothetical protein